MLLTVRNRAAIVFSVFAAAAPAPLLAQASFAGAGQEAELDCNGGKADIQGADNTLVIGGSCTELTVQGAGNRIRVDLASLSTIHVQGAGNDINWTAPADSKPKVMISGVDNRVHRTR